LLSEKGKNGTVYNQGAQRTNSVLTYILLCLEGLGNQVKKIESVRGEKVVENPTERNRAKQFGCKFEKTHIDSLMLAGELEYTLQDKGIYAYTDKGRILIEFNTKRFRPSDVPILMADTGKIQKLGFEAKLTLEDIIKDQLEYYMNEKNRV
jgi:GDPmannose 4,6-dehydratase